MGRGCCLFGSFFAINDNQKFDYQKSYIRDTYLALWNVIYKYIPLSTFVYGMVY